MATASTPAGQPGPSEPTFGAFLLACRLAASLTQEELAAASGVSVRTISELETGRRAVPQSASATLLADALALAGDDREAFFAAIRRRRHQRLKSLPAAAPQCEDGTPGPDQILGRDRDLARVEARFAAGDRLVTLLGPGGVGKSRLARAFADRRARPANGLHPLWVDLAPITDPALVIAAIARAAGATDATLPAIA
ncbi:MAG: helix-turn-helix domain-containing protein, partial [Chloroflexota bacterium]